MEVDAFDCKLLQCANPLDGDSKVLAVFLSGPQNRGEKKKRRRRDRTNGEQIAETTNFPRPDRQRRADAKSERHRLRRDRNEEILHGCRNVSAFEFRRSGVKDGGGPRLGRLI